MEKQRAYKFELPKVHQRAALETKLIGLLQTHNIDPDIDEAAGVIRFHAMTSVGNAILRELAQGGCVILPGHEDQS